MTIETPFSEKKGTSILGLRGKGAFAESGEIINETSPVHLLEHMQLSKEELVLNQNGPEALLEIETITRSKEKGPTHRAICILTEMIPPYPGASINKNLQTLMHVPDGFHVFSDSVVGTLLLSNTEKYMICRVHEVTKKGIVPRENAFFVLERKKVTFNPGPFYLVESYACDGQNHPVDDSTVLFYPHHERCGVTENGRGVVITPLSRQESIISSVDRIAQLKDKPEAANAEHYFTQPTRIYRRPPADTSAAFIKAKVYNDSCQAILDLL